MGFSRSLWILLGHYMVDYYGLCIGVCMTIKGNNKQSQLIVVCNCKLWLIIFFILTNECLYKALCCVI